MQSSTLPPKNSEFRQILEDYETRNAPHIEAKKLTSAIELVSRSGGGKTIKSLRAFAEAQNIQLAENFAQQISKLVASNSLVAKGEGQRMNIYFTPWQWEEYQKHPENFACDLTPFDRFQQAVEDMKRDRKVLSLRVLERKYNLHSSFISHDKEALKTMRELRAEFGCASKEQTRQKAKTRARAMQALDQLEREQRSLPQRKFCKEFDFSIHLFKNYPDVRERLAQLTERFGLPVVEKKTCPPSAPKKSPKPKKPATPKPAPVSSEPKVSVKVTSPEVFEKRALAQQKKIAAAKEREEKSFALTDRHHQILSAFRYQDLRTASQINLFAGKIDRRLIDRTLQDLLDMSVLKLTSKTPYTYELLDRSTLKAVC